MMLAAQFAPIRGIWAGFFAPAGGTHREDAWPDWLAQAQAPATPDEMRNFANGLREDENAIRAALRHDWSNGPVEGQVNRLKTLKRRMYGRANFDLLRRRLLLAS